MLKIALIFCGAIAFVNCVPIADDINSEAINYMTNFGYYKRPDSQLGHVASEQTIRKSIKAMQRFAGISVTGVVDTKTQELLHRPRCGLPDMSEDDLKTRKRKFLAHSTKWNKTDLTWKLTNDNNDGLSREQVENVMEQAFSKWNTVTNLNFRKLSLLSRDKVDIVVKFVIRDHSDGYPFDGPGGTLAHAFFPLNNEGISGDVHFDDDEVFTIGSSLGINLLWVAIHEIGHSIGLRHSNLLNAIMYPFYRGSTGADVDLHADDITGIQSIYGKPPIPTECTSTFKAVFLNKKSGRTYIINYDAVYILSNSNLRLKEGPLALSTIFPGIDRVDAAYEDDDGNITLFKDKMYYKYNSPVNAKLIESDSIFTKYTGLNSNVERIDAVFTWNVYNRTYLFSGKDYYRYDPKIQTVDPGYPRLIVGSWKGIPANIDSVFEWADKLTYFFKGNSYYRFDNNKIAVVPNFPKLISPIWTQCS